jgi:excisionase family DNA binding protein
MENNSQGQTSSWPTNRLLKIREVAGALGISPAMVQKLKRTNRIKVVHIGRSVRIPHAEVMRLCDGGVL